MTPGRPWRQWRQWRHKPEAAAQPGTDYSDYSDYNDYPRESRNAPVLAYALALRVMLSFERTSKIQVSSWHCCDP